jgi:Leucine rich repeat
MLKASASYQLGFLCTSTYTCQSTSSTYGTLCVCLKLNFPVTTRRNLQGVGLVGTLPATLQGLEALKVLNLANNRLNGSLPSSWGSLHSLPALQQLNLAQNQLSGGLPSEWGSKQRWSSLQLLDLSVNNLTGQLPQTWLQAGEELWKLGILSVYCRIRISDVHVL